MPKYKYLNKKELVYKPDVFTIVGSPTITDDGIASGFSSGNYITNNLPALGSQPFKIVTKLNTGKAGTNRYICKLGTSAYRSVLLINNSNNLAFWTVINDGNNTDVTPQYRNIPANTDLFVKIEWDGNYYWVSISYDGETWLDSTKRASTYPLVTYNQSGIYIGYLGTDTGVYASGSIDLKQFSITVDGKEVFSGSEYNGVGINFQDVYTSEISFNTQINEMQQGQEQRYPVWTYPKRTFTLKFDKSFEGRQELENFYIDVMTNDGGKFLFEWAEEKGGNGQTYTCWIDGESLEQNIKDFGFTDATLKFICIDASEVQEVTSLDFYHKAEANYNIAFNAIHDKIVTASYKLRRLWQAPRRTWTLTFDKNNETRKQIEAFFIAKRGKFRAFQWKWDKKYGGDDQTYNVRFDDDTLNMDIEEYGFSEFQIKLKEVIPTLNPLSEYDKDEIIPRKLLRIELTGGDINILDNETLDVLTYLGTDYLGAPLEHGNITKDDNSSVNKLEIKISNIGLGISSIIGNRGDVISHAPAVITMVLLNVNTNAIISGTETVLFAGRCNNLILTNETAKMDIETPIGGFEYNCPVMKYRTSCQVRRFKDVRCGYTGNATTCDRTLARCKELGNQARFAGFPSIPQETVIKV